MLGRSFSSSVFPTPARVTLGAQSYVEANAVNKAKTGRGLSKQSYFILPKIRELDLWLQAAGNACRLVREAHPEVAFMAIKREPLAHKKKTEAGFTERLALLCTLDSGVAATVELILGQTRRKDVAADDVLDACCLALMPLAGRLQTLPMQPQRDAIGLPMEICYFS